MSRVEKSPEEKANEAVVQSFGKLIDAGKVDEAFDKYVSKDFNDHSDMLRNMLKKQQVGYADAASMFKKMPEMGGGGAGPKKAFVEKITADDDMVTAQGRVGQDIYRVKDGKITDHWDTLGGFTGGGPGPGGPPAPGAPPK
jgi:predicted SnoaL-like aldol condensation-catalyzing enzyme